MFARGNWSVLALVPGSLAAFREALTHPYRMLAVSQIAATSVVRAASVPATGINPFAQPRLDEQVALDFRTQEALARFKAADPTEREAAFRSLSNLEVIETLIPEGLAESRLQLDPNVDCYGFWFVTNEWKDVGDAASLKEAEAYKQHSRPYKLLSATDKKSVDAIVDSASAVTRKQFPVLLDFHTGRLWAETTNKNLLLALSALLSGLGVETGSLLWNFGTPSWQVNLFTKLYAETRYRESFLSRAADIRRLGSHMVEKLEDKELEKIVADFFSMTELENEHWVGLAAPASIRAFEASDPVVAQTNANSTLLIDLSDSASVTQATVVFQRRESRTKRSGEEMVYRNSMFSLDITDNMHIEDAGAALVRGFDLPSFRKEILSEIRRSKQVPPIGILWLRWLSTMQEAIRDFVEGVRLVLDIDGAEPVGLLPLGELEDHRVHESEIRQPALSVRDDPEGK